MAPPRIDVLGLGPAGPDLLTAHALGLIAQVEHRYVRTARHPAATAVGGTALDHHYETQASFEAVYEAIVDELVAAAAEHGHILYAVPGSPRVAEQTVELLARRDDVEVAVHPALSFLDLAWVALGIDPIEAGVRVVDGHRFAVDAAGERGPLLVAQCHSSQVLSDIKLAVDDPGDVRVTVLQRLGGPDESIFEVDWTDLDRNVAADHLTSLYIPQLATPVAAEFARFDELVRRLRQDCPWDAEQTHASLRRYLLEESYETLEALDSLADGTDSPVELADRYADLEEELGDLLYQVFFHSILATEQGWFTVADVARRIHDKLYERHPHVFGDVELTLDELSVHWEEAKRAEKDRASVMDGIPAALPALIYATKVQKKALAIGAAAVDPLAGVTATDDAAIGELLFAAVALARTQGIDPESALRQYTTFYANHIREFG